MATKKTGGALVPWEQQMKAAAVKVSSGEKTADGFKNISIRGGVMMIDDEAVPDNELEVVCLIGVHANLFYASDYDPDTPTVPTCYAFGDTEADDPAETMAPHEKAEDPQADACAGCPQNEWGTAERGRGKACRNVRRIAVVPADAAESAEELDKSEVRMLQLPVTSVKFWSKYASRLASDMERPPFGVVTKIKVSPDPKTQWKVTFEFVNLVNFDGSLWESMQKKVAEAKEALTRAFPTQEELDAMRAEAPARGKGAKTRKVIPIKKASGPAAKKVVVKKKF